MANKPALEVEICLCLRVELQAKDVRADRKGLLLDKGRRGQIDGSKRQCMGIAMPMKDRDIMKMSERA